MKQKMKSKTILLLIVCFLISLLSACSTQKERVKLPVDYQKYLTTINPDFMITSSEAFDWHKYKDTHGPTYSGNKSWQKFLAFTQKKLQEFGVIDISQNKWSYDRWYTSDWPDDNNWSLKSDGRPIPVAHYGAYSGSTGPEGLTAELVLFNPKAPLTAMAGKIVVIATAPHPKPPLKDDYKKWFTLNDYGYLSNPETFPPIFKEKNGSYMGTLAHGICCIPG